MKANDAVKHFQFEGDVVSCEPYGNGHINDTFLVITSSKGKQSRYILQKLNTKIFPNYEGLMSNISSVTNCLQKCIQSNGGDTKRECMTIIKTNEQKDYYCFNGFCWRAYLFVEDTIALQISHDPEVFGDSGRAFGKFIAQLSDFDATTLIEVIPNFHNTKDRYAKFEKAVQQNLSGRADQVIEQIDFVNKRKDICGIIVDALECNAIPLRVTHNDTKLNNVLIDDKTNKAICVIDLDTIMPGSLLYDFGDSCRFGCSTASEDEQDLEKVDFSLQLYDAYCKGFLQGIGDNITKNEIDMLHIGAKLMTFECGMRFLTDFLDGDVYFKTAYPTHNLVRAKTQFKLVERIEELSNEMINIAKKYYKE